MNPKITKALVDTPVYFDPDVIALFKPFRSNMMWRLDLCNYEDVLQNFDNIMGLVTSGQMPPDPFPKLTEGDIQVLQNWQGGNFPLKAHGISET